MSSIDRSPVAKHTKSCARNKLLLLKLHLSDKPISAATLLINYEQKCIHILTSNHCALLYDIYNLHICLEIW